MMWSNSRSRRVATKILRRQSRESTSHWFGLASAAIVLALLIAPSGTASGSEGVVDPDRPNVVVILADDLGYADVGIHGCRDIPTPNIDSIAARGVRCTSGYASHPFCSPTRAGFMTARYQHRFGYVSNVAFDPQNTRIGLPVSETTVPDRLKAVGYRTGMVGKWHLGASHVHHPNRRGFEEFFGFLGGGHQYFEVDYHRPMGEGYYQPLDHNGKPADLTSYLTDALTDHAVSFIRDHREEPFFLYVAYNAPHTPLQAPDDVLAKFAGIKDKRRRTYAAMVHQMDVGIGRIVAEIDKWKLRENTIVFFLSDNGGPTTVNGSSNAPLRGNKGDVYEGGIRVPFVVSWPGVLPEGASYEQPVISLDISRTALEVAGSKQVASSDGVNLIPFLSGRDRSTPHEALFFRKDNGIAWCVRSDRWKLVAFDNGDQMQLYDVDADIGESRDLAKAHPEVVTRLQRAYSKWNAGNQDSIFPGFRDYHRLKNAFYEQLESG